jgi:ADP-heptose:LPS heptosyltransferase
MTSIKHIGIFRALYLGDMLCIIPTVRAFRVSFPDARITLIGLPWQRKFAGRFAHYFDDFIEFPGWPGLPEQNYDVKEILSFLDAMQEQRFDLVLQMQGNGAITNSLCMLWGSEMVCGLKREGSFEPEKFFPVSEDDESEIMRFLKLADALQIPRKGTDLEFPISPEESKWFNEMNQGLMLTSGNYVCLHPGARDPRRRWPVANFALIGNELALKGYTVVLTGSQDEKSILAELQEQINSPVINIVKEFGQIGIGELAALIKFSTLLLSNDTGVSHIAAALKVPSVIIFSPFSNLKRWAPIDQTKHIAIPFETSKDAGYVLDKVLHHLKAARVMQV